MERVYFEFLTIDSNSTSPRRVQPRPRIPLALVHILYCYPVTVYFSMHPHHNVLVNLLVVRTACMLYSIWNHEHHEYVTQLGLLNTTIFYVSHFNIQSLVQNCIAD